MIKTTLNPDTIWSVIYTGLANNESTKITDPNDSRSNPELAIFSSMPDYSSQQNYPIFIIEPPMLTEMGYAINSPTRVVKGPVTIQTFALSSASLKNAINVIKTAIRGMKDYLQINGITLVFSVDEMMFDDDKADSWIEEGKKIHFQAFDFQIKSTGTS